MNELDEEQYKNLNKEIEDLMEENLNNNNNNNNEEEERDKKEEIEKLLSFLKYIWKKDLLYNFSILFQKIVEKEYIKKTEFFSVNSIINKNLKSNKKIKVIQLSIDLYKNYNIEFNEETNFDFFKKIKSIPNINDIVDFLLNSNTQNLKNKLNELENNNYFDYTYTINILRNLIDFKTFLDSILYNIYEDKKIASEFINVLLQSKEYQKNLTTVIFNFPLISTNFNNDLKE